MNGLAEACHNPEVAAAALERPEQVWVFRLACHHKASLGCHNIGLDDVVAGKAVAPSQPADTARKRQSCDARSRDDATRCCPPERRSRRIEIAPGSAALGISESEVRRHAHMVHG